MSLFATARALSLSAPAKPVLRELALLADEAGSVEVARSLGEIGAAVGCSASTARRAVAELVELGHVDRVRRDGSSTVYRLLIEPTPSSLAPLPNWKGCQTATPSNLAPSQPDRSQVGRGDRPDPCQVATPPDAAPKGTRSSRSFPPPTEGKKQAAHVHARDGLAADLDDRPEPGQLEPERPTSDRPGPGPVELELDEAKRAAVDQAAIEADLAETRRALQRDAIGDLAEARLPEEVFAAWRSRWGLTRPMNEAEVTATLRYVEGEGLGPVLAALYAADLITDSPRGYLRRLLTDPEARAEALPRGVVRCYEEAGIALVLDDQDLVHRGYQGDQLGDREGAPEADRDARIERAASAIVGLDWTTRRKFLSAEERADIRDDVEARLVELDAQSDTGWVRAQRKLEQDLAQLPADRQPQRRASYRRGGSVFGAAVALTSGAAGAAGHRDAPPAPSAARRPGSTAGAEHGGALPVAELVECWCDPFEGACGECANHKRPRPDRHAGPDVCTTCDGDGWVTVEGQGRGTLVSRYRRACGACRGSGRGTGYGAGA